MPAASAHEASLLPRARDLDPRALGEIHDRYYPEIYRYALYRTGDRAAAEDIAGETFVRLLDALHAGRAPRATLRGWLFGTASHLVADYFRRAPTLPLSETLAGDDSPPVAAEERWQRQQVRDAIRRLTDEQQAALALRFGDGFSVERTAEVMGKSVAAVKALQFRALEALRRRLAEVNDE